MSAEAIGADRRARSELVNESGVPEQRARRCLIEAQTAAIARAMARICNDEQAPFGVMSGDGGVVHKFSVGEIVEAWTQPDRFGLHAVIATAAAGAGGNPIASFSSA